MRGCLYVDTEENNTARTDARTHAVNNNKQNFL